MKFCLGSPLSPHSVVAAISLRARIPASRGMQGGSQPPVDSMCPPKERKQ
jgi:hypothetical protein